MQVKKEYNVDALKASGGYLTRASSSRELPPGAILLSDKDVLKHRLNVIHSWMPKSQVWPFAYGHHILAAFAGFGGFYINHHYRKVLKLQNYARMAMYIPSVFLPSAAGALLHYAFVMTNILLEKDRCSVCLETRAMFIQMFAGGFYPIVLAPVAGFSFAERYYTYPIPPLKANLQETIALWKKLTIPRAPQFATIIILQALLSAYITRQEAYVVYNILDKADEVGPNLDFS